MSWYLAVLKNYIGFSGRARRREYWMFALFHIIAIVVVSLLDRLLFDEQRAYLTMVYGVATILPALAVSVRRLHDTDRSGWWYLISFVPLVGPIILLVFAASDGNAGPNRFGEDPKVPALANA